MSYRTRPYIPFTLGLIPNPFLVHDVANGRLVTQRTVFGLFRYRAPARVNIEVVSTDPQQNLFQSWLNIGHVEIAARGVTKTVRNISGLKAFSEAIENGGTPSVSSEAITDGGSTELDVDELEANLQHRMPR